MPSTNRLTAVTTGERFASHRSLNPVPANMQFIEEISVSDASSIFKVLMGKIAYEACKSLMLLD